MSPEQWAVVALESALGNRGVDWHDDDLVAAVARAIREAVTEERLRCAAVVEANPCPLGPDPDEHAELACRIREGT